MIIIPNRWKNNIDVPNHRPDNQSDLELPTHQPEYFQNHAAENSNNKKKNTWPSPEHNR